MLASRIFGKLVTMSPEALTPAPFLMRWKYEGNNKFKAVQGGQNGDFGEITEAIHDPVSGRYNMKTGDTVITPFDFP